MRIEEPPFPLPPKSVVESYLLPAPASHSLMYAPSTVHTVSRIISKFLAAHVTRRLDLSWQLQYLSDIQGKNKWDVKNLQK